MTQDTTLGVALVLAGGMLHGSFALPMKRLQGWQWENTWLVYSVVAMIAFPLALALATVPHLFAAFQAVPGTTLAAIAFYGFGWGLGSTLFGLGIARIGMALGFAIILGITSSLGSLLPLLVQNPAELWTPRGYALLAGLALAVVGISFCSVAGGMREQQATRRHILTGLLICIASGVLSPMLNFGFVFGSRLQDAAVAQGASQPLAANAIWTVALAAGFLANAGYCVYLLQKNGTWALFTKKRVPASYWLGAVLMGLLWFGGISTYGMGAATLGRLGGVVGWPVFMAMVILIANIWGAVSGEWKGASAKARAYSWTGIAVLIAAIYVISKGA